MNIQLTWDLFVFVFFGIIIAYSFIIGQNSTLKIIVGTYAAALAADAAGNLTAGYFMKSKALIKALGGVGLSAATDTASVLKISVFILLVILLTIRSGISLEAKTGGSLFSRFALTGFFGFLSAGLIVSTILMYVSGLSFIAGGISASQTSILSFSGQSPFIQQLLTYYNWFFLLPVVALLAREFLSQE
jgi:hypothetical protein